MNVRHAFGRRPDVVKLAWLDLRKAPLKSLNVHKCMFGVSYQRWGRCLDTGILPVVTDAAGSANDQNLETSLRIRGPLAAFLAVATEVGVPLLEWCRS